MTTYDEENGPTLIPFSPIGDEGKITKKFDGVDHSQVAQMRNDKVGRLILAGIPDVINMAKICIKHENGGEKR